MKWLSWKKYFEFLTGSMFISAFILVVAPVILICLLVRPLFPESKRIYEL